MFGIKWFSRQNVWKSTLIWWVGGFLCVELGFWAYCQQNAAQREKQLAPICQPRVILSLYQMLKDTDELLSVYRIPYLIFSGTLLGAVRHHGMIPWDDDIDIALPESAQEAFIQLIPLFKKLGYRVLPETFGYRIVKPLSPGWVWNFMGKTYFWRMTCIDVFVLTVKEKSMVVSSDLWPDQYFKLSEIYPLKRYRFGALWVLGPKEAVPYLQRTYGNEWNTVAYRQINHATASSGHVRVRLEPKHRQPAQPTGPLANRTEALKGGVAQKIPF